jgi:hypothetical protein
MRMLLNVTFPHEPFNQAVRDGSAGDKMERILKELQPEAVYFTEQDGKRSAILIVDIDHPAKVPSLAEPWFLIFGADVELRIVMSPQDLKSAGLEELGRRWQ